MSKAFTREDDADQQSDLPERAIPTYPNLVTAEGLAQIEEALTRLTEQHNDARAAGDVPYSPIQLLSVVRGFLGDA